MSNRVYIFVPQLADNPPLNPVRKAFHSPSDAIQEARTFLIGIGNRAGVKGGSVMVGDHPSEDGAQWLGLWRWTPEGLWSWESEGPL